MEDRQIVQSMKDGREGAFDALYESYSDRLYKAAYVLCGNEADAQDILQETFLTAFKNIGKLRDETKLRYWLYRILTNAAHRFYRKRAREIPQDDMERVADEAQSRQAHAEDMADVFFLKTTMADAIRSLPLQQRESIFWYYYEGLTTREIARMLHCPEATVKSRLFKARRALKQVLKEPVPYAGVGKTVTQGE